MVPLGELGKYVPFSPQRFADIQVPGDVIIMALKGEPGEHVTIHVAVESKLRAHETVIGVYGTATLRLDGCAGWSVKSEINTIVFSYFNELTKGKCRNTMTVELSGFV